MTPNNPERLGEAFRQGFEESTRKVAYIVPQGPFFLPASRHLGRPYRLHIGRLTLTVQWRKRAAA